jgi:tetratricopeptide (TPR) repeat protein
MVNVKTDVIKSFFVSVILLIAIIVSYWQVTHFNFVCYDDNTYVTNNSNIQQGITPKTIKWAFTTFYDANYHPLTWLSHMLDFKLYGSNAAGHHWTNVEFHIANTLLLFFILFKMTGALWQSAFAAALFALHPLHVESVAWVAERKDVLSTFFGFLTMGAYYRYVKKTDAKNYLWVIVLLSLGLMAKPMLVTLPFVLLLMDFWPLKRFHFKNDSIIPSDTKNRFGIKTNYRLILEKIPLCVPVAISCALTFLAQKDAGAVQALRQLPVKDRITNALVSYIDYVLKMFWPSKLAVFYPHPGNTLPDWKVYGAALLLAGSCFAAYRAAKKYPYIVVGLFWYLVTLVPVIGLVQVGEQAMADRYTYIPLIGLFIIVAWGGSELFKKWRYQKVFLGVISVVVLSALTICTSYQLRYWKNAVTLFEHAIKVTKNNYLGQNNLGAAYAPVNIDIAISHYKEALKIQPNCSLVLFNLGTAFSDKKEYNEAYLYLTKSIKFNPKRTEARMNLANVASIQGKFDEAVSQYNKILEIHPDNANAHYNLAHVMTAQGKLDEAVSQYEEALRINPRYSNAHYYLGNILLNEGKTKEAFMHFTEVIRINPDDARAFNKLGLILLNQGKYKHARVFFSKALQLDPGFSEARTILGRLNNVLKERKP